MSSHPSASLDCETHDWSEWIIDGDFHGRYCYVCYLHQYKWVPVG